MEYDVIIIGGGITGAGTARDCALRGLRVLLLERGDIATGATGRNHGLLHSGARYAMKDMESAQECIQENRILRKIAPHCIEDTQGLFITLPEDAKTGFGLDYQALFIEACRKAGIDAKAISPEEARKLEPSVNPELIGAVLVPDGSVDPFKLCTANILDARLHGAQVLSYHEVKEFIKVGDRVVGVRALNRLTGETREFRAPVTVNAAGIWGAGIADLAGAHINMFPAKGTLLVFGHRVNKVVLNRCRKSADGDILVPGDTVSIIGTTSTRIPFEECDSTQPTAEEVELMLREGCALSPQLATTRIIRAYSGVRPLVADDSDPSGRSISRGIVCLDHEQRDGIRDFITITGGKLMTYRLMAQMATDAVCSKLGISVSCTTATTQLPDPVIPRHHKQGSSPLVCECESVSVKDVEDAIENLDVKNLMDLRRRTRVGMGTCQGTSCIKKAAKILADAKGLDAGQLEKDYVRERWKGMVPVGWGDTIREMELMQKVYKEGIEL